VADGQEVEKGICSGEFFVLIVDKQRIRPHVLRSILASDFVLDIVKKYQSGTALPRLHQNDFLDIPIPIPPMDIQVQIEHFLLKANEYRRRLTAELESLPGATMRQLVNTLKTGISLPDEISF
jgi:restriction endonuclease S subunit